MRSGGRCVPEGKGGYACDVDSWQGTNNNKKMAKLIMGG
jgi:hypothetical protein